MLYYCDGPDVSDVVNKTDCMNKGSNYRWINKRYNFDDLGQVKNSSRTLFLVLSLACKQLDFGNLDISLVRICFTVA
jgi:hypothetical protein